MKKTTFIDYANIKIKAGKGGDGKMGFHKEKYVEHGGPSGGNGGNGGSIFFRATNNENTLLSYKGRSQYKGFDGGDGGLKNMTGFRGEDLYLDVPVGTEILENGNKVADLQYDGQLWLAALGGKGGRGNKSFKSSKNTTPTLFELGEKTYWKELTLNLKVLADVGLLGYPNAGKSTLVSSITNAKTKIDNYEFTTLTPQLGIVKNKESEFIISDLPGLIDGASKNKGMGIDFLKHLSRTRLILHLIDSTQFDLKKKYESLRNELKEYSISLYNKPEIIVFSKRDLIDDEIADWIKKEFKEKNIYFISSLNKTGLSEIVNLISDEILKIKNIENKKFNDLLLSDDYKVYSLNEEDDELKINYYDGIWEISNKFTKFWANRIPQTSSENSWRLISKFKSKGIIDKLLKSGMKNGDIILVKDSAFSYKYENE